MVDMPDVNKTPVLFYPATVNQGVSLFSIHCKYSKFGSFQIWCINTGYVYT